MKAFEKHLANDCPQVRPTSVDAEIMRQEWRAALERLYEELDCSEGDKRIKDWINAELED